MDKFYESKVRHKRSCLYIIPLIGNVQNRHIYRDRMQVTGCQKLGEGRNGVTPKGYGVSFGSDKNVLKLIMTMVAKLFEHTKSHWIVHFLERFTYFILWLWWVFIAVCGLSLVGMRVGVQRLLTATGFSCGVWALGHRGSGAPAPGL